MFAFRHFEPKQGVKEGTLEDLPTVSVCVPARNETHAMAQCLEAVIASTYQKLEIIVLDDSSVDNTSFLIKSFAHAGVRFVEGSPLESGWFGKNNALQGLLDEASGDFILYMDVDTKIKPDTISQLVSCIKDEQAAMISVLPRREDGWRASVIMSTLRYFWTLILHRSSRPAVASSAWMVDRHVLIDQLGGIKAYKNDIQPELKIATELTKKNSYRFFIGSESLGVGYEKRWCSQVDTSVRLMFASLDRNFFKVLLAILVLLLLNMPLLGLIAGFFVGWTIIQTMALWQLCIFIAIYGLYLNRVWSKGWWLGALLWPVIIAQELIVLMTSIDRYLRRVVAWKGRPVTTSYSLRVK